jgi:hypothetical protein
MQFIFLPNLRARCGISSSQTLATPWPGVATKSSVSGDFMTQFPTHQYFGNCAEEFHPHETLYFHETFIISLYQCSVMSAYLMPIKLYETPIDIDLMVRNKKKGS